MSIQTKNHKKVHLIPLSLIKRPLEPIIDSEKVDAMVSTYKGIPTASKTCSLAEAELFKGELPPVDVMHVTENDLHYYFAFGGCHRFKAYERIAFERNIDPLVACKLLPVKRSQLTIYLGSSLDKFFESRD